MPFQENIAVFFNTDDFATIAIYKNNRISGIFSEGYIEIKNIASCRPLFTCALTDVKEAILQDSLTINQTDYQIIAAKPDGTHSIITLVLEKMLCN